MFEIEMHESSTNEINISDFSEKAVRAFLFCLKRNSTFTESVFEEAPEELLAMANKYQVKRLIQNAELYFKSILSVDNAISMLLFVDIHSETMKGFVVNFIASRMPYFNDNYNLKEELGIDIYNEILVCHNESLSSDPIKDESRFMYMCI
jgi:hypothetical protein